MCCRELATWAELLQLKAIWIVTTILLGDVVTFFALDTGHSDLWADIRALTCHGRAPFNSFKFVLREVKITSPTLNMKNGFGHHTLYAQIERKEM